MKTTVTNNPRYNWVNDRINDDSIYFVGGCWWQNNYYTEKKACKKIKKIVEQFLEDQEGIFPQTIKDQIGKLTGHYAFIIDSPHFMIACADKIRSYPIFYAKTSDGFYISNSAIDLQANANLTEFDNDSVLEFQMSGFVTGSNTLYKGLKQLQGGEFLFYKKNNNKLLVERHFTYFPSSLFELSEENLLKKHDEAINLTFSKLVDSLDGAPVWIPLSGGLDSRLILAKMIESGYDNINTFTYGIPQLWEVKYAREIAKSAKIKWQFILYDPHQIKKIYHTVEREKYYRFGSGLCSVPFVNEYFALNFLIETQIIPEDSVIINGQSGDFLTGGHIPAGLEKTENSIVSFEYLINLITEKHFSLWSNLKSSDNLKIIKEKIRKAILPFISGSMSLDNAACAYELHEWQERQCKYVVNGQRVYDWFGFDWRLPLWSDELMKFWRDVPWRIKFGQRLYKKYLTQYNPKNLFDLDIKVSRNYCPPFLRLPSRIYSGLAKIFNLDDDFFNRTFIKYFGAYSPYYPQKTYSEFLKDSRYHRNTVSYHSIILLKNLMNSGLN